VCVLSTDRRRRHTRERRRKRRQPVRSRRSSRDIVRRSAERWRTGRGPRCESRWQSGWRAEWRWRWTRRPTAGRRSTWRRHWTAGTRRPCTSSWTSQSAGTMHVVQLNESAMTGDWRMHVLPTVLSRSHAIPAYATHSTHRKGKVLSPRRVALGDLNTTYYYYFIFSVITLVARVFVGCLCLFEVCPIPSYTFIPMGWKQAASAEACTWQGPCATPYKHPRLESSWSFSKLQ